MGGKWSSNTIDQPRGLSLGVSLGAIQGITQRHVQYVASRRSDLPLAWKGNFNEIILHVGLSIRVDEALIVENEETVRPLDNCEPSPPIF